MKTQVAVLYGGRSGEHEVSIRSAESIISALDPERYDILHFVISEEGKWDPHPIVPEPGANQGIDVVFPVLHGTFGEDGTIQGLLELADLPYVGPGVLASAAAMDKEFTKRVCEEAGIYTVEYLISYPGDELELPAENGVDYPVFVKPARLGSSVGISKARNAQELSEAVALASQYDSKVLIENTIIGRELECAVLGNNEPVASLPCEILPSREFYDYEDKYLLDQTEFRIPAELPDELLAEIQDVAILAYRALGCEGMARVDFLYDEERGQLYLNEVNTIPGFTSISMYPKMWEQTGLPYSQLLDELIQLAFERHARKQALKYTR